MPSWLSSHCRGIEMDLQWVVFQRLKSQMDPIHNRHYQHHCLPEPRYFEYLITNISITGDVGNLIFRLTHHLDFYSN
jgi:hypothetical protein